MKYSEFIFENRVDNFKSSYSKKFDETTLDRIVNLIQPKYLLWAGKALDILKGSGNFDENLMKLKNYLDIFDKISSNLTKTDLNSYNSLDELVSEIEKYKSKPRRKYKQVEGGNVVYENDRFFLINPLTQEASCYYGKGTKWCTASETNNQFQKYNDDGKLFYLLDKTLPTNDINYKIAILKKFDDEVSYWDAKDDKMTDKYFNLHMGQNKDLIMNVINQYLETEFKEQLDIFRDKERAKAERNRLEKLRRQREIDRRVAECQERRSEDEWNLNNGDIDEEGLKAHALMDYIEQEGIYPVLTNEDKEKIRSLRNQISILSQEYENSEDVRTDLLDKISELEDELDEYDEYVDVYSFIPLEHTHYGMTMFEKCDELDSNSYAVGTEREVEEGAVEYVEQLLDDIGYEGFNKSFVENYVDEDEVVSYFEEFYETDVRDSPDSYLDDEDRELSNEQQAEVNKIVRTIKSYRLLIDNLNENLNDESFESKYEEIEKRIEVLESKIEDLEEEIEDINSEPEGDYKEDRIQQVVEDRVEDVRNNPISYLRDWDLDVNNFINRADFIAGIIDTDGYGMMNSYDGEYDVFNVKGQNFYVMRIN